MTRTNNANAWIEQCCYPGCSAERFEQPDAPPFCGKHLIECGLYIAKHMSSMNLLDPDRQDRSALAPDTPVGQHQAVVYYVRLGNHVKIGTTNNLDQRLRDLYVHADPSALLACEPGDRTLERERHHQFAAERVYSNRELFNPSPRLLHHIETLNHQQQRAS